MDEVISNYALVDAGGDVVNVIVWDGNPDNWQPPEGQQAVLVPSDVPVSAGWTYVDGNFVAPPPPPVIPPTPAQILADNTAHRNALLAAANLVIPALQDAVDLDDPSANPALLLQWKQFRVNVNKVVLTVQNPAWPTAPQAGYGAAITQPVSSS